MDSKEHLTKVKQVMRSLLSCSPQNFSLILRLMADKLKTCKYNTDSVQCINIASFSEVKAEGSQRFFLYQGFYLFQLHV